MRHAWVLLVLGACGVPVPLPHDADVGRARPDVPNSGEMFHYASSDVVDSFDSDGGTFKIHYTRTGANAVPAADTDVNNVPDHVERVAALYDEVGSFYQSTLGFRPAVPDDFVTTGNGGDARFDVYLLDFDLSADGAFRSEACTAANNELCTGYMVQENDFAGYGYPSVDWGNRVLSSHEYFHAVQAAYDVNQGSVLAEGTAVWATEKLDPALNDFEGFIDGYMQNPDHSLDKPLPGPVDSFSYGSALFFKFLDEKHPDAIRYLWEACVNGANGATDPQWLQVINGVLAARFSTTFPELFASFLEANLFTGRFANPAHGYADARNYPLVRLDLEPAPVQTAALRVFYASAQYHEVSAAGRTQMTARLVGTEASLADMVLSVTRKTATTIDAPQRVLGGAAAAVVTTGAADSFIAIVANTATTGQSHRPGLCVGTPEEVTACVAALSGGSDAGVTTDAGSGGGGDTPPPDKKRGPCQCQAPTARAWPVTAVVALAFAVRRRRRT